MSRRIVHDGGSYSVDDDNVQLEQVSRYDEPPVDIQGEPWGWTKPGPKPRGWREDGDYRGT